MFLEYIYLAAQVASNDLASELKAMNEESYNISGQVYTRGSQGIWVYRDTATNFSFTMEFAVSPKNLKEIKSKCIFVIGQPRCQITGKAEMDTSRTDFILILYQIDELKLVN